MHDSNRNDKSNTVLSSKTLLDMCCLSLIVLAFMALADWKARNPMHLRWLQQDMSGHLGAECDSIAQAIVAGRGFSDPFQEPSGPTAWMPPVLPYLTAAVYWLTGNNRSYVIDFFVTLHAIAVLLMGWIVIRQARRLRK